MKDESPPSEGPIQGPPRNVGHCVRCGAIWPLNTVQQCPQCKFVRPRLGLGGRDWARPRPWTARPRDNFTDPMWEVVDGEGTVIGTAMSEADAKAIAVAHSAVDAIEKTVGIKTTPEQMAVRLRLILEEAGVIKHEV